MLGKIVFFKICFINKLYKYKWYVMFLLLIYILYKIIKILDVCIYFIFFSCNEDNVLLFDIYYFFLGIWY